MAQRAPGIVSEISAATLDVRRQHQAARPKRNIVLVLCLDDKLKQLVVAERGATDRLESLKASAKADDSSRTRHEYTVLQVLAERASLLRDEAWQCGEE
jgi:hypothetical protein